MNHALLPPGLIAAAVLLANSTGNALAAESALRPIEEIVVTARKREEHFLDVPTAVTVIDSEALANIGAVRLQDVELRLPNMATNQSPLTGFTARYVRGMNATARNVGFESGYGVFVDGVYGGRYAASNRILQSVERIEYLPGPQATLFGKNTTLGVLNIVTRVPDPAPAADLSVDMGSHGQRGTRLDAATGIGSDWTVWGSLGREVRDGFDRNLPTGTRGNDTDHADAMIALDGALGGFRVRVAGDYFRSSPDLIARQRLEGYGALPERRAGNDLDGTLEDEDRGMSLRLERDLSWGTLTAVSAVRAFDTTMSMDDDAWELPIQHLVDWQESDRQLSQELRVSGDRGPVSYVAGAYYQDQEADLERNVESLFGVGRVRGAVDTTTLALFGNLGYDLTERMTAEAGIRWTREQKSMPLYTQDGGGVLIDFAEQAQRTASSATPSASLHYRVTDTTTAYARYAQSFKSGGFNVDVVTAPTVTPLEFDDERADGAELGLKSTLLDGRLQIDAALFHTRYDDLQVSQYAVTPGALLPTLRVTNAAAATTTGGELGIDLQLGAWELGSLVGYTHGEVDRFPDPLGPGTGDWSGNGLGGPDWTTSTWLGYRRAVAGVGQLTLGAEQLYQGALGGDLSDDPRSVSDSITLTNLSAALTFGRAERWTARLRVDNVFDVDRVVERRQTAAPGLLMLLGFPPEIADSTVGLYNAPRTYGLELKVRL